MIHKTLQIHVLIHTVDVYVTAIKIGPKISIKIFINISLSFVDVITDIFSMSYKFPVFLIINYQTNMINMNIIWNFGYCELYRPSSHL